MNLTLKRVYTVDTISVGIYHRGKLFLEKDTQTKAPFDFNKSYLFIFRPAFIFPEIVGKI